MLTCSSCGKENPDGFAFCGHCSAPLAEQSPSPALEERKVVSVLFCDLVGFTAASEQQDPEDVRARIRPYHARLRQEIERYGATVEKFVGDAVMAVCGAPVAHEDDAERAVRAGLRILEAIAELNEADPDLDLQVRVGINTGEAVVAVGARPEEGEGIVTGDVVNTAARIQSAAPVNGVAVGEQTYRATSEVFEYEPLAPVSVKGKAEPLSLWRAKATRARFGSDIQRQHATPLVGRALEKPLLIGTFERAAQQRSVQLVTIIGEPGVGKSRLAAELFAYTDAKPELTRWRQGRCLPYGERITFWALGEIVKAEAGILESDSAEVAAAKLEAAVSPEEPDRQWLLQRLAPLVGVEADSPAERQELFTAWRRFLEGLAAARASVLVFEDLHWADEALLAFLEYLAEWSQGVPLLILCTARPELYERHPGWGAGQRNAQTINLSPLSEQETAELVSHLITTTLLTQELEQAILERAGGNPLYAEEFARLLGDRGLEQGADVLAGSALPESLQALIAARLDTLSPERKSVLQDAAVLGKVFWAGALAEIGGRDEGELELALHELARKELVRPARTSSMEGESEYSFWHLLVRDVAYSQIPRAERARRHRSAAAWIERQAGERLEDLAEVLAHHYVEALELARILGAGQGAEELEPHARRCLALAGDRVYALDAERAEIYYRRALDLAPAGDPARGQLLARLGDVTQYTGRLPEAERLSEAAVEELRAHGDLLGAGQAMVTRALALWRLGRPEDERRRLVAHAIRTLEQMAPGQELARAYARMGTEDLHAGRSVACCEWSLKAVAVADRLGMEFLKCRPLQALGNARVDLGDLSGVDDMRRALQIGLDTGLSWETGTAYSNLGEVVWLLEGPAAGLDLKRAAVEFSASRGLIYYEKYIRAEMLWLLFDLGAWDELLTSADEGLAWDRDHGGSQVPMIALTMKVRVLLSRGRAADASALEPEYLPAAREIGDPQALVPALATAAEARYATGDTGGAVHLIEELEEKMRGRAVSRRVQELPTAARICAGSGAIETARALLPSEEELFSGRARHCVATAQAVLAEATGDVDEAQELYAAAAAGWQEFGNPGERAYALLGEGRCLLELGRGGDAGAPLGKARELFAALKARPLVAEADGWLEQARALTP